MLKQALPVSLHKGLFRISRYLWDHAEDILCFCAIRYAAA